MYLVQASRLRGWGSFIFAEDLAISPMGEIATLGDGLEREGVLTRQEIYTAITDLRRRHPDATTLGRPPRNTIR